MEISCHGYVYEDSTSLKVTIILCAILNFSLSIPTFFLNLAVFVATLKCKHLPHVTQVFFASLALADSLTACFSQLMTAVNFTLLSLKKSPCFIAEFSGSLSFAVISVSFLTSICLALERYISVLHPFVYSAKATRRKAVGTTVFIWFICCVCVLPRLVNKTSTVISIVAGSAIIWFEILCAVCYSRVYLVTRRIRRQISVEEKRFDIVPKGKAESKLSWALALSYYHYMLLLPISGGFSFQFDQHKENSCLFSILDLDGCAYKCIDQSFDYLLAIISYSKWCFVTLEKTGKSQYYNDET